MNREPHKTILVTGGAGFIGSHLCKRLAKDGHRVISLDNYFTGSRANHVAGVEYREGHTKDIEKHISETPDLIFHLGEYARVEQSILEPEVVHDLNTLGTRGVLEFWRMRGGKLVYAGSSTKFGDGGLARERTPYALTKAANTELVKEYGENYKLPFAITYFYNVYGPRERAGVYGTVIEHFKRMYLSGAPLTVVSPGTQKRNFTHVDDIVNGLVLIGEKGHGDEYGLGNERSFSVLEVAQLFGADIVMLPPRAGNRMESALDARKSAELGWKSARSLEEYVREFTRENPRGASRERRVLVFSTTFYPVMGSAERALLSLMRTIPDIEFDVVAAAFSPEARGEAPSPAPNVRIHRVGVGRPIDKYLLPFLGFWKAWALRRGHRYLFAWSLMASYAALAALLLKRVVRLPLLVTLADQRFDALPALSRIALRLILSDADQVYGVSASQESRAASISKRVLSRSFLGEGDAFANQLRYAYAETLLADLKKAAPPKKKILIFSLAYYPHVGGAEVAVKEITDRIGDIEFHMITHQFERESPREETLGNVHVHRIGFGTSYLSKILFIPMAALAAARLHRTIHFNALWAMMSYMLLPIVLLRLIGTKLPYILTLQEGDPFEHVFKRWWVVPFLPLLRSGFRGASIVTAISTFLGGWARRMGYRGHVEIIPNGVDTARFSGSPPDVALNEVKDRLGKKMDDVFLVTTSRLVHKNAVDDVIRALPLLPENIRFLVLGVGPDEGKLRALADALGVAARVSFVGHVSHDELPKYLKVSDIFIRVSRSEGMGNSFVEAMAAGLPVIATQEGGLADFIFDEKRNPDKPITAWAVDKDSPGQIAEAVRGIISRPEKIRAVTATARAMVLEKYDWIRIAKDMAERVFKRVFPER